ncbi:hypothetical protein ABMA27_016961 [Loxostege sticticalis]|uniref:TIR domain-containing protein n=1 Tax=Loxostege sticticalis TaxID=481309 RepID=A0ABR3GYL1_LOXSC
MMRCKTMLLLTLTLSASARAWYNLNDCGGGPSQSSKFFDPMASITLERFYDPKCGCNVTFLGQFCRVGFPLKITIECNSHDSDFTAIPAFEKFSQASNFTLIALSMSHCKLPSTFASLLANFGHADAELLEIMLESMGGELQGTHVRGLRKVRKMVLYKAAKQNRIPRDLFDSLPDLEEFDVSFAQLRLEASGGDDSIDEPSYFALRSLRLTSCGINVVPPGAFARLGNITELYLGHNFIENITWDAFRGLKNLETLSLSNNPITSLPPRAFAFTPRLRRLYLDQTLLKTVPGDAFQGLQHLELITLKKGNATIKFGARALALSSLEELTIESALQTPLPKDLIEGSVALQTLIIRYAGLKIIPKGFFATQQRLQKLDLSGNELTTLDADVFQSLKALVALNMSGNRIKEFPNDIFFGLSKLETVSANNNSLQYIATDAFDATNSITHLALNDNLLTSEVLSSLRHFWVLPKLKELRLQGNRISYMIPNWKQIYSLEILDLSRNNIMALEQADFMFRNPKLEINLRENHITNIKFHSLPSTMLWFKTSVFLGENPFRCDCELYMFIKAFQYPPNTSFIPKITLDQAACASPPTLAGALIQDLPLTSFTCSLPPRDCPANCTCDVRPGVRTLELDCKVEPSVYPNPGNHAQKTILRLRKLQSKPLILPSHVVSLNLADLGLTKPPLLKTHNIQKLDLSRNQLTDAPLELLKENISLRLSGNEFICDCSHLDNVYALQSNGAWIDDAQSVTCKGGEYLMHIKVEKLCEIRKETVIGVTLAVLGGLVAVVAGFAYRCSHKIKLFLFSHGWCQSWVQEDDIDNAEYDAFVSFSQDDAQWVAEQLLPILEGEPNNYKLCVHYRDWVVGDMIPAQIATSVERSRRTIVVLTKNFLKSTWAPLEFRAANAHAQRERRAQVLIVVLGEIPDCEEMDAELRAYLSTNTYLKWGDPWFWEKLKYAMPHRRQNIG